MALLSNARLRQAAIVVTHAVLIFCSLVIAAVLRFEFTLPPSEAFVLRQGLLLALITKMASFGVAGMHRAGWRYVSVSDLARILAGNLAGSLLFALTAMVVIGPRFPRSIYIFDFLICFVLTGGVRFAVRLQREAVRARRSKASKKSVLIYGAGDSAATLLKEIRQNSNLDLNVVGMLDDNPRKQTATLLGVHVLGRGRDAALLVQRFAARGIKIEEIIIAMPSATGRQMSEALANCRAAGVPAKTIPGMSEILTGKFLNSQIRDVSVVDLLGRQPVQLDRATIQESLEGKAVMVTGAAGSIGSEICRQIAKYNPRCIVAFERAESDLFRLNNEMLERAAGVAFIPRIGDIREADSVEDAIRAHGIDCIFHAAAYKHVPMMEDHIVEAVQNNVFGTKTLVEAAVQNRVRNFVMISSDKAVRPTNIMGATKRIAELIVSGLNEQASHSTKFVSVRFGNVLGSNGSVVPLFREQIAKGGPVTVTHPEIQRYFMTIPEAVELVLQASTMGKGSEIFVLDMGEPVKIVDLARNMIRLSGKEPDSEIEIRFTGLRPGEKLSEEISLEGEDMMPTFHPKIRIFKDQAIESREVRYELARLLRAAENRDLTGVIEEITRLVPEYTPSAAWRERLDQARGATEPQSKKRVYAVGAGA